MNLPQHPENELVNLYFYQLPCYFGFLLIFNQKAIHLVQMQGKKALVALRLHFCGEQIIPEVNLEVSIGRTKHVISIVII